MPLRSDRAGGPGRGLGRGVDVGFALTALLLLAAMVALDGAATVPYHVMFVVFAAVYGYRTWPLPVTVLVLGAVILSTGSVLFADWRAGEIPGDELFEIVLMPLIVGAMIWHARRRVVAQQQVELLMQQEREARVREHEFARDTSHALRTPLTIARGHIELLHESARDDGVRADAEVALAELDRLDRMASRLLAIAELERPDTLSVRPVDVAALVRETHARWAASVARRWSLDCPETLRAPVDDDVLRAVLDALIENAVKVTSPHERVRVVCRPTAAAVLVAVEDGGPGIAPADAPFVFDRFWRSSQKRQGSGLGLSFVRAAVEAHGGTVQLGSSAEGGAAIGCLLPRGPAGVPGQARSPDATRTGVPVAP